jgi:hypothetical protein
LSSGVKSHELPGQGFGPVLPTQPSVVGSKVPSALKTTTQDFQLLIPHKQNPHTKINQLAVTAKIFSQPGIQLRVAIIALLSWQTDFKWLHERLPWLVQLSGLI